MLEFTTVYYPDGDTETPLTVEITDAGADDGDAPTMQCPDPTPWVEFKVMDAEGNEITDDLPGDDLDRIEEECFNALDREYAEGQQTAAEYRMEARYGY